MYSKHCLFCYNAMFCWEILCPGIHVDVPLRLATYLNNFADQSQTIQMATAVLYQSNRLQQDTVGPVKEKYLRRA